MTSVAEGEDDMILTIGVNRSSDKFSDSTLAILAKTTALCQNIEFWHIA